MRSQLESLGEQQRSALSHRGYSITRGSRGAYAVIFEVVAKCKKKWRANAAV